MKKVLTLVFALTIITASSSFAQLPDNEVAGGPKINFEETSFDFGEIEEGSYAKHIFEFKNIGDKPLLLKEVKPACGCTASEWTREPILPGEKGSVTAVFNSRGYGGRSFHKSISVTTNMGTNAQKVLFFKGNVIKKVTEPVEQPVQSPVRIENQ
ncbi:MAG: DUF1573 domain-containing protein [Bacteroidetes bacterium]|nr:DUF1573 domain-containing protein [Bacteroidota bacterium]MBT6838146.1 DUF1573 domain-containing protein [Bacteroidota bacterium]MBT7825650.1 DUF1573 domain-containing protein [Bacteroidota bacterium]MBT7994441.1 DUF1573 domain-containing protein [Bacteroidota bacterium]